jgi:hypothetical protein
VELDVNKRDEDVLKDLLNEVKKSIDQSLKHLAIADKEIACIWFLCLMITQLFVSA